MQRMRLQSTDLNPLNGIIIFPFVRPSGCPRAFCDFCICINFQCRGPASRSIYPHSGVRRTPMGSSQAYMSVSMSLCLSVSLSGHLCFILVIICASHNFVQRMQPQATGSNPLSGSIICPFVCPSVRSSAGLLRYLYFY